jgi:hypothetical protein
VWVWLALLSVCDKWQAGFLSVEVCGWGSGSQCCIRFAPPLTGHGSALSNLLSARPAACNRFFLQKLYSLPAACSPTCCCLLAAYIHCNPYARLPPCLQTVTLVPVGRVTNASVALRQAELLAYYNLTLPAEAAAGAPAPTTGAGAPFAVGATVDFGGNLSLPITINGTGKPDGAGSWQVESAEMWVDTFNAGPASQGAIWGGPVPLPPGGVPATDVELRVSVDRSLVEVYGLGGRARTTVRVYPLDPLSSWGLSLFGRVEGGDVMAAARAGELESCWVKSLPV